MIGFQPVIPVSGYAGWLFLEKTSESQRATFEKSPELQRDIQYFKDNIHNATTAEDLVKDRRLLKIALGAFGLEDDLDKRAYVLKALVEGTDSKNAFANRMVDKRYQEFSKTFGYGNFLGARMANSGFAENVLSKFKELNFEKAVGESNNSMRLAMTFAREIAGLANTSNAGESAWFKVLGNPPIRQVFEVAFGLPKSFGSLDIDKQREVFSEKTDRLLGNGSISVFKAQENVEKLIRTFFVRQQMSESPNSVSGSSTALTLLRSSTIGVSNLFQSRL